MPKPVLYSFRRCPYAMRARMAVYYSGIECELREILLKNKPAEMLSVSEKGTVPVLIDGDDILDESLDVMHWALNQSDPQKWLKPSSQYYLVENNDGDFKFYLDRYKYFDRYPEHSQTEYFEKAVPFLEELESSLSKTKIEQPFLCGKHITWVDIAIFPFIRQFAYVDKTRFDQLPLTKLLKWLNYHLSSDLFNAVMQKYPVWQPGQDGVNFGNGSQFNKGR